MRTYSLIIPDESLAFLNSDPAAEEYVEGMLVFEGDTISPVGIRYKGSIGAFSNCLSGNNPFEPSGEKVCTKLSMKVKVNWDGSDQKFFGLKKLQFHSQNLDPSQLHERLGYWLFREMGVAAPRSVHARLLINGEYSGLYALTEQIDGRLTRQNFENGEGNLYKEIWPLTENGNAQTESKLLAALKTNEDENPSVDIMRDFGIELASASDESVQSVIEKWMDIDNTIKMCVVDRAIKHDDGPFHWYCFGGDCFNHNYYFYEDSDNKKVHLIPWDLDNAFSNFSNPNIVTNIPDEWGEISNNCEPFASNFFGIQQKSAACDKLTQGWVSYDELYEQYKNDFFEGPFSADAVNAQITKWKDQIRAATLEATEKHGDAVTMTNWALAVEELITQTEISRQN